MLKRFTFNGEGTLVYPAQPVGYEGVAPSIRLKALRDGIEDYEYLVLAEKAGQARAAHSILLRLAPSWTQWDKDPAAYQQARAQIAGLLVSTAGR